MFRLFLHHYSLQRPRQVAHRPVAREARLLPQSQRCGRFCVFVLTCTYLPHHNETLKRLVWEARLRALPRPENIGGIRRVATWERFDERTAGKRLSRTSSSRRGSRYQVRFSCCNFIVRANSSRVKTDRPTSLAKSRGFNFIPSSQYPREFRKDVVAVARRRDPGVTLKQIAEDDLPRARTPPPPPEPTP